MSEKKSPDSAAPQDNPEVSQSFDEFEKEQSQGKQEGTGAQAELQAALEKAQAEAKAHWDKLLRKEAEYQNYVKRSEAAVSNAKKFGIEKFAQELLAVADSFEQGFAQLESQEGVDASVLDGMRLTQKVMLDAMAKFGVEEINPADKPFDPQFHEAISMQETPEAKPNHVLAVVQKGYSLHERVLRPARVVVAKAPTSQESATKQD